MTLYQRLRRRLGKDTKTTVTATRPVYEYRIIHTNGDVSEEMAHTYHTDGAFARFYTYNDSYVWNLHGYAISPCGMDETRVLDSIKEIRQEKIGETTFTATVDKADGNIIEKDVTTEAIEL